MGFFTVTYVILAGRPKTFHGVRAENDVEAVLKTYSQFIKTGEVEEIHVEVEDFIDDD